MSVLASSMPWIGAFLAAFALASLASVFTYWLARRYSKTNADRYVVCMALVLCVLPFLIALVLDSRFVGHALLFVFVSAGASGLQALVERALRGETHAITPHFWRSLLTYVSTALLFFVLVSTLALTLGGVVVRAFPSYIPSWLFDFWMAHYSFVMRAPLTTRVPFWVLSFSTAFGGLLAGWLIAPLSISFYRFLFQNIRLRPGIDRPLQKGELVP